SSLEAPTLTPRGERSSCLTKGEPSTSAAWARRSWRTRQKATSGGTKRKSSSRAWGPGGGAGGGGRGAGGGGGGAPGGRGGGAAVAGGWHRYVVSRSPRRGERRWPPGIRGPWRQAFAPWACCLIH